jgi:hypothetical protein
MEGESLKIPATVTGLKSLISNLTVEIKRSLRGEVPTDDKPIAATLTVQDYTSPEITNGYLFTLSNNTLPVGIYYVNYRYQAGGFTYKGEPLKVLIKESVL